MEVVLIAVLPFGTRLRIRAATHDYEAKSKGNQRAPKRSVRELPAHGGHCSTGSGLW